MVGGLVRLDRYVVDGGGLACLGLLVRDGGRRADLRKPLAVMLQLALSGGELLCYFDRNLPYRVMEEQRDLLDLLLAEHPEEFRLVPSMADATDYLLQRAGSEGAAFVNPDDLLSQAGFLDSYPWLSDPDRNLRPRLAGDFLDCPPLDPIGYASVSAFDLYHDLIPRLSRT